ncbi:MAG TPA: hypothetical protein VF972_04480, partial [Actinomycetota bacterium]
YFGCWLDINQPTVVMPPSGSSATGDGPYTPTRSVQDVIRGQHQCLVAEINLDPPEPQIATGASPATSDKLAQRNLTIVGVASPHTVPTTFDIKPTSAELPAGEIPDELMLDWGKLPEASTARIYLPGTNAQDILAMADKLYSGHDLSRSDAHTVTCAARGITYVPVPPGVGSNYAGLLTIEVPDRVERGQVYEVLIRQLRNVAAPRPTPPPPPPPPPGLVETALVGASVKGKERDLIRWRRVLGTFQLSIPVQSRPDLLATDERLLSVLRWIARSIPPTERWYEVFRRYLSEVAGRVRALGGDPDQITPSSSGEGWRKPQAVFGPDVLCVTGKVTRLIFDRYGDFEGFILDAEGGDRSYFSQERDLAELAERAWRERLRITVCARPQSPERPEGLIVDEPPVAFGPRRTGDRRPRAL